MNEDTAEFNRQRWDQIAIDNDRWFKGVTREEIAAAKQGDWKIRITAQKAVPHSWLEPIANTKVLCLAGAGGRQAPILSALGAEVSVFDISEHQLQRDQVIAEREGLNIKLVQGDMTDLSAFENESFDLILNPCSVCYVSNVRPVWRESFRVLKAGGRLISGMINPLNYLFDEREKDRDELVVRHSIPYCDLDLPEAERETILGDNRPVDFGHSLTDLIGGVLDAGFELRGFFEDKWGGGDKLSQHIDVFFAILAIKG